MVGEIIERFGQIDILVNCQGWDRLEPFVESNEETWEKLLAINFKSVLYTARAVLPHMISHNFGKVVNISSDAGRVGSSWEAVYAGAKGAVIAFSKTIAREVARYHINVNVVCPGLTETPLLQAVRSQSEQTAKIIDAVTKATPFRRPAQPEEIAERRSVSYLARGGFYHRPNAERERRIDDGVKGSYQNSEVSIQNILAPDFSIPNDNETNSMRNGINAIDIMYYVATPEFIQRWNDAKKGELICRMEKAIGGLPQFDSFDAMLAKMDEAGVDKVFITQTKMWSYRNKWMYMDTQLEEVAQYTKRYPDRFVGLAGYNPFRIKESLAEIDLRGQRAWLQGRLRSHLRFRHSAARRQDVSALCQMRRTQNSRFAASRPCVGSDAERACPADLSRSHRQRFPRTETYRRPHRLALGRGADLGLLQVGQCLFRRRRLDAQIHEARDHPLRQQSHGPGPLSVGHQWPILERESGSVGRDGTQRSDQEKTAAR